MTCNGNCVCNCVTTGKTYIAIVLDESGSMAASQPATISGFNEYIDSFRKYDDVYVTLTKFNGTSKVVFNSMAAKNVPVLDYRNYTPSGSTALFDAVADAVNAIDRVATANDRVLVLILSDGQENASVEYKTKSAIKNLITSKEAKGNFTFTFMGANQDAWAEGFSIGIPVYNTITYTTTNTGGAWNTLRSASEAYYASDGGKIGTAAVTDFYGGSKTVEEAENESSAEVR